MFSIAEEIFLLSLLERKETLRLPPSLSLPFALAGATILDLALSGAIKLEDGRLLLLDGAQMQAHPNQGVIEKIQKTGKSRRVDFWIFQMGLRRNRVTKPVQSALVEKGILREDGNNYRWGLGTGASGANETQDVMTVKYLLKRRLRDGLFCQAAVDEHVAAIFCLMNSCGMLDHLLTEDELFSGRKRVNRLLKGEGLDGAYAELLARVIAGVEYGIAAAISA